MLSLVVQSSVDSVERLEFTELDLVRFNVSAQDPDGDVLTYTFYPPLDENGVWQTTYEDSGVYRTQIDVSDGDFVNTYYFDLIIHDLNRDPVLDSVFPGQHVLIHETESIYFEAFASDEDTEDVLTYEWFISNVSMNQTGQRMNMFTDYDSAMDTTVTVRITDGDAVIEYVWNVSILDTNRVVDLSNLTDVYINEGDTFVLQLPEVDPDGDVLSYTYSDLFEDGIYTPEYEDAGIYQVGITASDSKEEVTFDVIVHVIDTNRKPVVFLQDLVYAHEGETVSYHLDVQDPDSDTLTFELVNPVEGMVLDNGTLQWTIPYDFVPRSYYDMVQQRLYFTVNDSEFVEEGFIDLFVVHTNMAPRLESVDEMSVQEGEQLWVYMNATDFDGDTLEYSLVGSVDKNGRTLGFDSAGKRYFLAVTSDGYTDVSSLVFVNVDDVNRAPELRVKSSYSLKEGESFTLSLDVVDEDYDAVQFSLDSVLPGMVLKDSMLFWNIGYDVVDASRQRFNATLYYTDGVAQLNTTLFFTVEDVDRDIELLGVSPTQALSVRVGEPVLFFVDAQDPDGKSLTYTWKFSLLESIEGGSLYKRTFTQPGDKLVTVVVSDGNNELEYVWNVHVY